MNRLIVIAALIASASPVAAQDFPTRPVRAIVAVGPGGTADIVTRVLGDELHKRWGQPLIVENRAGGASNIGARACADAPPDGYTICVLSGEPLAYNAFLFKKLSFDAARDFAPITNLFFNTQALVINAALDAKTVDELVALSKAKAGTLSYTAPSPPLMLYLEKLKRERGADWVGIPFRGGGETTNAVLSGSTPIAFLGLQNFISHLQAGTMRGLATDGAERTPLFPEMPTLAELGYRGNLTRVYFGLVAPAGTPKPIIEQDPRRRRPHRRRSGVPAEAVRRPRARADSGYAGGVRALPRRQPRDLRARGEGGGPAAAVAQGRLRPSSRVLKRSAMRAVSPRVPTPRISPSRQERDGSIRATSTAATPPRAGSPSAGPACRP